MADHHVSLHHHHKQKSKKKSPFQKFVDKFIYVIAFFSPIMTLPQVWNIWVGQDASGVSALSWGSYIIASSFWFAYAIYHKQKPLIISALLWIILEILIVTGTLIYG